MCSGKEMCIRYRKYPIHNVHNSKDVYNCTDIQT